MTKQTLVSNLCGIIKNQLSPLIDSDYYLLEIPYYTNIGDTLIWQGELDFLKQIPHKCKGMFSLDTFNYPNISENDIILFQGGGNFGDLWRKHHDFKLEVVKRYPNNKIVFFPQTVYFESEAELHRSADILGLCKNVTICARDSRSYELLKKSFVNTVLLAPDMAFCIDIKSHITPFSLKATKEAVFVKRKDKELLLDANYPYVDGNVDVSDWPTFVYPPDYPTRILEKLKSYLPKGRSLLMLYANSFYRRYLLWTGSRFLSKYKTVFATRLHAAILGILLEKEVVVIDNSYGKNSEFFNTWLTDTNGVSLME